MVPIYSKRLAEARKRAGYSQVQVKAHTDINNKTLSGYEKGNSEPDFDTLKKLCDLYGVTTDWVLGNTNNPDVVLDEGKRKAANAVQLNDEAAFMSMDWIIGNRELTEAEKKKLFDMARLILREDR